MSRYFNVDKTDDSTFEEATTADNAMKIFTPDSAELSDKKEDRKIEPKKKKKRKRDIESSGNAESLAQMETHDLSSTNLSHSTINKHKTKLKHLKDEHGQKKIRGKVGSLIVAKYLYYFDL